MLGTALGDGARGRGRLIFIFVSLVVLAICFLGISRLWVRAGVPFTWEEHAQQMTVREVLAPSCPLLPGDVLLGNDATPLRHSEELEFLLDVKQAGDAFPIK